MLKLTNQPIVESFSDGMILAGIKDGKWQGFPIGLFTQEILLKVDKTYTHNQDTPSSEWVCKHDLSKFPSVSIIDSAGTEVEGVITHNSQTQVTLTFSAAFSGNAYFN